MFYNRLRVKHTALVLQVFVLAALLYACGGNALQPAPEGGAAQPVAQAPAANPALALNIPLPQDPYMDPAVIEARQASYSETRIRLGDEFFDKHASTLVDGVNHVLQLNPQRKKYSYGLYQFDMLTMQDMPLQISVTLGNPPPATFYIGITDYIRERWVWSEVSVPLSDNTVSVPAGLMPVNPGGVTYVAVVAYDQQITKIAQVFITVNIKAPAPVNLAASDGVSGSTVHLTWNDLAVSFPGIAYDRILVERAAAAAGPWELIGQASVGSTSYNDVCDAGANLYPHNIPQYYRLKTVVAGNPGLPCTPETGYRLLGPVTGVAATDGLFTDKVVITWNPVVGASGYTVSYHNESGGFPMGWSMLTLISGGNTTSFEHTSTSPEHRECMANNIYSYRAVATFQLDQSPVNSNEDTGYRNSLPAAALMATPYNGNPPLSVDFDASASTDPDGGTITKYEWDWTGDGTYELTGTDALVSYEYTKQGAFHPVVRVTDDENSTQTATVAVTVLGWAHSWGVGGAEVLYSAAIDTSGQVYAAGEAPDGNGNKDVLFMKHDAAGAVLWAKTWGDDGGDDVATSLMVDFAGNAYIGGYTANYGEGSDDMLLLKYDSAGTLIWQKTWGGNGNDRALGLFTNGASGIFLAGWSDGFSAGDADLILVQITNAGTVMLEKKWDGGVDEQATCITSDGTSVQVGGFTNSFGAGGEDTLLLVFDNLGNVTWQKTWGDTLDERALGIALKSGEVHLAGTTTSFGAGATDAFVLKYDSGGSIAWEKSWGDTADEAFTGLVVDTGGNVYLSGETASMTVGVVNPMLVKYDSLGALAWSKGWTSGTPSRAFGLGMNFAGAIALVGQTPNSYYGVWSQPAMVAADTTGTANDVSGTATNVSGVIADASGTEGSPSGTLDSGGGGADALVLKVGPGL